MSTINGPCWVRYNDGHVAWLQAGWQAFAHECTRLPCLDLGRLLHAPQVRQPPRTREEYEQAVWDAYRTNDRHKTVLALSGLNGPDDFEAALKSKIVLNEDDPEDIEISGPMYLRDYVWHTITAFAEGLPFKRPV